MDRGKLIEELFEDENDFVADVVKRMSSYLSDEQLCDCLRIALMRRCSSDVAMDLNTSVNYAIEISFEDAYDVTDEDIIGNVLYYVQDEFSRVLPLYTIGEDAFADNFLRELATELQTPHSKYETVIPLLKLMGNDLMDCINRHDVPAWFEMGPDRYVDKVNVIVNSRVGRSTITQPKTPAEAMTVEVMEIIREYMDDYAVEDIEKALIERFEGGPKDGRLENLLREHVLRDFNMNEEVALSIDVAVNVFADDMWDEGYTDDEIDDILSSGDERWVESLVESFREDFQIIQVLWNLGMQKEALDMDTKLADQLVIQSQDSYAAPESFMVLAMMVRRSVEEGYATKWL